MGNLLVIEKKARHLVKTISKRKFEQDKVDRFINSIKEDFKYLKSYYKEIEDLLTETKEFLESQSFHSEEDKASMLQAINSMRSASDFLASQAQMIKSSEVLLSLEKSTYPGLVSKLEKLSEDVEDIAENIEIGMKFNKELSKLEPLLKEYSKVSEEVDLKKKFEKI